jgi:hypothetical protein
MSDAEAFVLGRAERSDCGALAAVTQTAFLNDPMWREMFRDVTVEDEIAFMAQLMNMRFDTPDSMPVFKITEVATGYVLCWRPFMLSFGESVPA